MVSTATAATLLDAEAFNQLVLEKGLRTWTAKGHRYAGFQGPKGWELYRTTAGVWDDIPVSSGITDNPAAGANPDTLTVPAGKRWRLTSLYFSMVTSADVATRICLLTITDGTNTLFSGNLVGTQAASTTYLYSEAVNLPATTSGSYRTGPIPDIELNAGWTVSITFTNIQAADDCTAMAYSYKEADA